MAQLALNTLKSDVVETKKGSTVNVGGVEIVTSIEYNRVELTTESDNYSVASGNVGTGAVSTDTGYGYQQLCEKLYGTDLRLLGTDADDLGRPASKWVYDKEDVVKITDEADYTIVVDKASKTVADWAEKANKKLSVAGGATFVGNGCSVTADTDTLNIGDVVEFYNVGKTAANQADDVIVTRYKVGKIDEIKDCNPSVKKDKDAMEDDGAKYVVKVQKSLSSDTKTSYYDTDIANFGSNYSEGAYIVYVEGTGGNAGKFIDSYIAETVDGKITAKDTKNNAVTADSKEYTTSVFASLDLGSEYTLVLDKTGYVIGAEEIEAADVDLSEVLFIVKEYETDETKYGDTLKTQWVQTVSMDGVAKDYALYTFDPDKGGTNANTSPDEQADIEDGTFIADAKIAAGCFITVEENDDTKDLWDASEASDKISDDYTVETGAVVSSRTDAIEKDDTKLPNTTIRVNSSTKYVIAEKEAASLKVYQATGGIEHTLSSADNMYAITETVKGTKVALYVVLDTDAYSDESTSKDVVYVDADADYQEIQVDGKSGYYTFDVYGPDGDAMTVIAENDPATITAGFATYSTKEKGGETIYTFKREAGDKLDSALVLSGAYDDEKGFKDDKFDSYYNTELNLDATHFKGIETKDAAFVDLHDTDDYGSTILSLEDMYNAKDEGYTVNLSVYLNKGAKLIVVTSVDEPHTHIWGAWSASGSTHTRTCTGTGTCPDSNTQTHTASNGSWVNTDASQHWHACGGTDCTLEGDSKASHDAAPTDGSATPGTDGSGNRIHTWTCQCGKTMSASCTGAQGSACTACGYDGT